MTRSNSWYRRRAKALFHKPREFEVDEFANVAPAPGGAYVQVWAWVQDVDEPEVQPKQEGGSKVTFTTWFVGKVLGWK